MKITFLKDILQEKLGVACRFCLTKISSVPLLQNGLLEFADKTLTITTTNLNEFFNTNIAIDVVEGNKSVVVDIKKVHEFLNLLPSGKVELEIVDSHIVIQSGKTKGVFPIVQAADFPKPPIISQKGFVFDKVFFENKLPLVLFSAATDETRPVLTGVKFHSEEDRSYIVATDGFRLSLLKYENTNIKNLSLLVSSHILSEVSRLIKEKKAQVVEMIVAQDEKLIKFVVGDVDIYSRIIEGDFPPFQKVVPTNHKTRMILDKDDFLRNIKIVSVFARELSNTIIFDIKKDGLNIYPKVRSSENTVVFQQIAFEGEEQSIAFNYKFILDFISSVPAKKITFEMTEKNAPGVFRIDSSIDFIHVVMPVRTEDIVD